MKTKLLNIAAVIIFLSGISVHAQIFQNWVKKFKGEDMNHDYGNSVETDLNGNIYVGGTSDTLYSRRLYVNKYSPDGTLLWTAYDSSAYFYDCYDLAIDNNSGSVAIIGRRGNLNYADIVTVKFSFSGVMQWERIYNGPTNNEDCPAALAFDSQGNLYITGYTLVSGQNYDYLTLKYSASGTFLWAAYYDRGPNIPDRARSLALDNSGNVYVTGISGSAGDNVSDAVTVKYSPIGTEMWVHRYTGAFDKAEGAYAVAVDNSGNAYITGFDGDTTNYPYWPMIVKISTAGLTLWSHVFYNMGFVNGYNWGTSIAVDNSNNVYVNGSFGYSNSNALTFKYNGDGVLQWYQIFDGGSADQGRGLKLDASGNPYVIIQSYAGQTDGYDFITIKYSAAGAQQWLMRYNRDIDYVNDIALDNSGNVYVIGTIDEHLGWGRANDAVLIKYSSVPTGVNEFTGEIPRSFALSQNYPNPFNPSTTIRFGIPEASNTRLIVYDNLGREITTLVNENLNAGTFEVSWNAGAYSSGVYYYRLISGNFSETKKMILTK